MLDTKAVLPKPTLVNVIGAVIDKVKSFENNYVNVSYPGMRTGDSVQLKWTVGSELTSRVQDIWSAAHTVTSEEFQLQEFFISIPATHCGYSYSDAEDDGSVHITYYLSSGESSVTAVYNIEKPGNPIP